MVGRVPGRIGNFAVGSIDRAGRCKHKVPDAEPPARLQHVQKPRHIGIDVGLRIFQTVTNAGLGGQVENRLEPVLGEQLREPAFVLQRAPHEPEPVPTGQAFDPRPLERSVVIIVQIVDADDGMSFLQQPARRMETDEARRSRNQYAHLRLPPSFND